MEEHEKALRFMSEASEKVKIIMGLVSEINDLTDKAFYKPLLFNAIDTKKLSIAVSEIEDRLK